MNRSKLNFIIDAVMCVAMLAYLDGDTYLDCTAAWDKGRPWFDIVGPQPA